DPLLQLARGNLRRVEHHKATLHRAPPSVRYRVSDGRGEQDPLGGQQRLVAVLLDHHRVAEHVVAAQRGVRVRCTMITAFSSITVSSSSSSAGISSGNSPCPWPRTRVYLLEVYSPYPCLR